MLPKSHDEPVNPSGAWTMAVELLSQAFERSVQSNVVSHREAHRWTSVWFGVNWKILSLKISSLSFVQCVFAGGETKDELSIDVLDILFSFGFSLGVSDCLGRWLICIRIWWIWCYVYFSFLIAIHGLSMCTGYIHEITHGTKHVPLISSSGRYWMSVGLASSSRCYWTVSRQRLHHFRPFRWSRC